MSRTTSGAVAAALLAVCAPAAAGGPAGQEASRFPGADAWGQVRVTAERMPAADFVVAPGGTEITFFGYSRAFWVYDLTLGRVVREVPCPDESVHDAAYSPDGRLLATAEWTAGLKLRDARTGRALTTLKPDAGLGAFYLKFLPDGKLAAYCWRAQAGQGSPMKEQLALWDLATKRRLGWPVTERVEAGGEIIRPRFLPGSRLLLSLRRKTERGYVVSRSATLTDPADNKTSPPVALDMDDDFVFDASPDGRTLLVANLNRPPRLVSVATGKTAQVLIGHKRYVTCGAFSPDGKLVATASGTTRPTRLAPPVLPPKEAPTEIILWDVATGRSVATLRDTTTAHDYWRLRFSPDGRFVVALTRPEKPGGRERQGGQMVLWGKLPPPAAAGPRAGPGAPPFVLSDRLDRFVEELAGSDRTPEQKAEAVFLAALGRFPTPAERARAVAAVRKSPADAAVWNKLLEALTATREYREHVEALQGRLGESKPQAPRP
jgi:dipeptidyl aminopeptidase/acylaminoacyl peptidase